MKENILIVHNYYQVPGGEDTVVANERQMLEENGHKVVLYSRNNSELSSYSLLRKLLLPITTIFNYSTYMDIQQIIKEEKIDIVHVHNTLNIVSPSVYYAALKMNVPVVQTIHNFRLLCPGATFYRDNQICEDCCKKGLLCSVKHGCYRNSKLQTLACVVSTKVHRIKRIYQKLFFICLTDFNKQKLLQLRQLQSKQIYVKPNFVQSKSKPLAYADRKDQFVYVGRLDELKGIRLLFETWKQIENEYNADTTELIVCGTGPLEQWCTEFISENNIKRIKLMGFIPNSEAIKIVGESKAIVLPTQCYEGFPMTIVEAASVGTPVIGSAIGNVGSIIQEGITGYQFNNKSSESLKNVIMTSEFDINDQVYEVYVKQYTKETNYRQLLECYQRAREYNGR